MALGEMDVEITIVGAGVVGLAIAAELAERGAQPLLLERHAGPGRETSSRNSEVIHAGIYYPPGSHKAKLCVEGNALLYAFCAKNGVAHRRLGKLLVATSDDERDALEHLAARARACGVANLQDCDRRELGRLEPELNGVAALLSPSTGIVDSHGLIKALEAKTSRYGGLTLYGRELEDVEPRESGGYALAIEVADGSREQILTRWLVNAAGLCADSVAAMAGAARYRLHHCRGDYFAVAGAMAKLVSRLIYPVPPAGAVQTLGVHLTPDLGGRLRLGPDATYVERNSNAARGDVDPAKADRFHRSVKKMLPGLERGALRADTFGIRPKLAGSGEGFSDFVIAEDRPGLINLVGIESPGLTAALAIARLVATMILGQG